MAISIERLGMENIRAVMALEAQCFAYHWTEAQFQLGLEAGAYVILGAKDDVGNVLGYIAFSLIADEMEILNIGVSPEHRRQGIGARLLDNAMRLAHASGARTCFLDVKASNAAAIDLYEKFGFKQCGVRKKYYPDTGEDALLYSCELA